MLISDAITEITIVTASTITTNAIVGSSENVLESGILSGGNIELDRSIGLAP